MGIVPVAFDKNDRIVIVDGLLKDMSGKVVAVNKRNKRVNIELEFMGGAKIVGLSYEVVKKIKSLKKIVNLILRLKQGVLYLRF